MGSSQGTSEAGMEWNRAAGGRPSGVEIVHRRPDFGDFGGLPRYWVGGNRQASFVQSCFSLVIPEGEKFFIRSVNAMRGGVKDEGLLKDMGDFSRQEASHTQAHERFNTALVRHGYDVQAVTRATKRLFLLIDRFFSKRTSLAITVFLEHLTALGSELEFRFPVLSAETEPRARAFWRWHAAEELEHKSVAFDVYRATGGSYFTRVASIFLLALFGGFIMMPVFRQQVSNLRAVRTVERGISIKEFQSRNPGLRKKLRRFILLYVLSYFRPGFRPWHVDSRRFLDSWSQEVELGSVSYV